MKTLKQNPLISVIIPTHNAETTIERCLMSVLGQEYQNIEVICCDDCSTDNTVDLLKRIAKSDKRVKVLVNDQNMRAAYTRNRCIFESTGEFIAQIDDDDYCAKDRFLIQLEFLLNNQFDMVGSGAFYYDENGVWGKTNFDVGFAPEKKDFIHGSVFMNPTMMYKAGALKKVGGYRVSKETRRGQDYDLHMRLYANGFRGYVIPNRIVYYYRGKNSYPKCKFRYKIDEVKIRYKNFKQLGLLPKYFIYTLKPILSGLISARIKDFFRRKARKL